jgi:hypothetical protein
MKTYRAHLLIAGLIAGRQALATGVGERPPHEMIDFFAKEGKSFPQTSKILRGKKIGTGSPDLDLVLSIGSGSKSDDAIKGSIPSTSQKRIKVASTIIGRRYNKYAWQRQLENDAQVEEIYRIIGSKWKAMPRSTLETSMIRLNDHLEKFPQAIRELQGQNQIVIDH